MFTLKILHDICIMPFPSVILPMFLGLGLVLTLLVKSSLPHNTLVTFLPISPFKNHWNYISTTHILPLSFSMDRTISLNTAEYQISSSYNNIITGSGKRKCWCLHRSPHLWLLPTTSNRCLVSV